MQTKEFAFCVEDKLEEFLLFGVKLCRKIIKQTLY